MSIDKLKQALVGRTIRKAGRDFIVLDNDDIIEFEGYGDCCAYGQVDRLSTLDNTITDVELIESDNEFSATIFALCEGDTRTEVAHLVGNEGSGCYCFGVHIKLNNAYIKDVSFQGEEEAW